MDVYWDWEICRFGLLFATFGSKEYRSDEFKCHKPNAANVVGEEEDVVYYKLPGAKKKQKKNKHDIIDAVDNVRGAEKNTREKKSCYLFFHS